MPAIAIPESKMCAEIRVASGMLRFYELMERFSPSRTGTRRLYSSTDRTCIKLTRRGLCRCGNIGSDKMTRLRMRDDNFNDAKDCSPR